MKTLRVAGVDRKRAARGARSAGASGDDAAAALAEGLAGYWGNRLAGSLGAALGRVSLAVRPLLLLGETDAAARLTLSPRAFAWYDVDSASFRADAGSYALVLASDAATEGGA